MDKNKGVLLIDGYGMLFRSFYAIPNLRNAQNIPVNAVFGMAKAILNMIGKIRFSYMCVLLDGEGSFRKEIYPEYKANRLACPEDLIPQFDLLKECLSAMGVPFLSAEKLEADDLIAIYAKQARQRNLFVRIVSHDKDLMQLVEDGYIHIYSDKSNSAMNSVAVFEKFGVDPDQITSYLALVGDSSDNVPGVAGIGPKTATTLLAKYKTLEGVYDNLEEIRSSWASKLLQGKDDAFLSYELVQLVKEDDTIIPVTQHPFIGLDVEGSRTFFTKHQMSKLNDVLNKYYNFDSQTGLL